MRECCWSLIYAITITIIIEYKKSRGTDQDWDHHHHHHHTHTHHSNEKFSPMIMDQNWDSKVCTHACTNCGPNYEANLLWGPFFLFFLIGMQYTLSIVIYSTHLPCPKREWTHFSPTEMIWAATTIVCDQATNDEKGGKRFAIEQMLGGKEWHQC